MTIKSALSVVALAAGLVVVPAFAQDAAATTTWPTTIGSLNVSEADAGAVKARCDDLRLSAETESLVEDTEEADEDADSNETSVAGDAAVNSEPNLTESPTATSIDLAVITLADCEAGGWFTE